MGGNHLSQEEVINACVVSAKKGNLIGINSMALQNLASYIKSSGAAEYPDTVNRY